MGMQYNDPAGGTQSSIGVQQVEFYWQKQALIELKKEQYFSQLADTTAMPKNMGKKIKRYHYMPLLDDRNINDQGIDAAGVTIDNTKYSVVFPKLVWTYAVEADATAAAAAANAIKSGVAVKTGSVTPWTVTLSQSIVDGGTQAQANTALASFLGSHSLQASGYLYGSSKDIGTITGKLPLLSETGGRVNRVGYKRLELEGTFEKMGFFSEYTQESLDFDSDAELMMHVNREMLNGANELTEDMLQIDLINAAGVIRYAGNATTNATIDATDVVTYGDLMRLGIDLDNNRTPKHTTVITGSRMVDTKTVPSCRVLYCGSELLPTLKEMVDLHGNPAFIPVQQYASAGNVLTGEEGAIDKFRIVIVPEMLKWSGAGGDASGTATHYETNSRYDVFPMLVVGDASFTTIGFQTDGKSVKFTIYNKKPGEGVADRTDPYGETGFMSIKWYYGFMALRPERIGLIKTAAKL